jgi:hypothetical protein
MTDSANSIVASQVTASGVVIFLMEVAKKIPWLPITQDSEKLNRWVAIIGSGLVAAGIHASYTWNPSTRAWTLSGVLPTLPAIGWGLAHWARSWIFQQGMFRGYRLSQYAPQLVDLLNKQPKA